MPLVHRCRWSLWNSQISVRPSGELVEHVPSGRDTRGPMHWEIMRRERSVLSAISKVRTLNSAVHCPPLDTAEISIFYRSAFVAMACNSVKVEIKFHLECKLHFLCAQLMLRQLHLTNVSENIEATVRIIELLPFFHVQQARITSYDNCLGSLILFSYRWLKIEVTARQNVISAVSLQCSWAFPPSVVHVDGL